MNEAEASGARRIASGVVWLALARIVSLAVSVLAMAVLARLLTPEAFGLVAACFVALGLPIAIYEGAFGLAIVQTRQIDDDFIRQNLWLALGLAIVLFVGLAVAAPYIEAFFSFEGLAPILILIGLALPLKALTAISFGMLQRAGRFPALAVIAMCGAVASNLLVAAPMAWMGYGAWSLAIGSVVGFAVEAIIAYALTRHPLAWPKSWKQAKELSMTSGFFTLTQALNWAALTTPSIVTGRMLGAEALGYYSRGWRLMEIAIGASAGPLQRTLIPAFSRMQDDLARARRAFIKALAVSTLLYAGLAALVIPQAEAIVRLLLGPQWSQATPAVALLFGGFLPRAAYKLNEAVALGFGKSGQTAARQAVYFVLMLTGAALGSGYGVAGVAAGVSIAIWLFYFYSLAAAARLAEAPAGPLIAAHLRAFGLGLAVLALGYGIVAAATPLGFWIAHVLAGLASAAALALASCAPKTIIGEEFAELRDGLFAAIGRRFARKSGLSETGA
jgi:PST family polysaccharide transporter